MILIKLLFIALIIVCAFFYILYIWDFALVLLVIVIFLPVVMFITTYITKRLINCEITVRDKTVSKNTLFPVQLIVENRSIFPIGKAEAHIEYSNGFSDSVSSFVIYFPIQPRNSQKITFQLNSEYCGLIRIRSAKLCIYDPLKLFRFKLSQSIQTEVTVSPTGYNVCGEVVFSDNIQDESEVFSENRPGNDPSEIYDLREYIPGDRLNRIHWKLSSKKDNFIVKEYSLPTDAPCALFLDLRSYCNDDKAIFVYDALIETFISLSTFLLDNEKRHSVIYFDPSLNSFTEQIISALPDLSHFITIVFSAFSNENECAPPDKYLLEISEFSYASFSLITSSHDMTYLDIIDSDIDSELKNVFLIMADDNCSQKLSGAFSAINITPVITGRISASIKDIEI